MPESTESVLKCSEERVARSLSISSAEGGADGDAGS